ncbi:MAG TPA: serine/threonine-protein kinase [Gemmatimonadaceae bacterium]|nr:serine/threonine-protein kinase [Gemmatimonadaceae bacterium]
MSRDSLVGQSIGGYTLKSPVGEGGTSAVYQAEHPRHGAVAVKILREKLRQDKTAVARFLREARYGERVRHPNVVRTIEIGEFPGGLHFIAIEWARGELLERYIKRNAPLPRDEVAQIVEQIAGAVHAAHDVNIVHRDLKPENVMYDPATRQIKLLDFGIATDTDISPAERLTRAGFFVGTLMYVAPEALSGELVTPAADQYSLATIAYFLLTGCHPYSAKSPREMFTLLLSKPPVALNEVKDGVRYGADVEAVVMRGLAKEPGRRYPSALAFAEALKQALAQNTDAPAGLLDRVKGFFRPKP